MVIARRADKAEFGADALRCAVANGASQPGQTNAVRKALTDAGYHLIK